MDQPKRSLRSLLISATALCLITLLSACGGGGGDGGPASYTVTGKSGGNGTLAPATQTVDAGGVAQLTLTPDDGYLISSVTGCGGTLSGNLYTTAPVNADCTVNAIFAEVSLIGSYAAGVDGSFTVPVPDTNVVLVGMVVPEDHTHVPTLLEAFERRDKNVPIVSDATIELRGEKDPNTGGLKTLTIKIKAVGYGTFMRTFEDVTGRIQFNAEMATSSGLQEIDIASLETSSLTRNGRSIGVKRIESDEQITIQMVKNSQTGKKRSRILRSSTPSDTPAMDPAEAVLVDFTFPLKGLRMAESSTRLLAEVAYIDSPNKPELMPGGFVAEGEGDSPIDLMVTFGASQIELFDDAGNKLLTDTADRTTPVNIRMLVPKESYFSIEDEEPEKEESVSVPYFYFHEVLQKWVLHRHENGDPAYSHLEDQFGNILTPHDVSLLKHTRDISYDAQGNKLIDPNTGLEMESNVVLDPQYAPEGVDPKDIRIYSVNKVHHFTTWNADAGYRAHAYQFDVVDKQGNKINPRVRLQKRSGGNTSDKCNPKQGRCTVHADRDYSRQANALIKLYLDRAMSASDRKEFFERMKRFDDPRQWNALIEALRNYGENLYDDIASDDSGGDLGRGIRKIFSNELINNSFINTDGVDCVKTPDLCRSIIASAGEQVNKSKSAQQATAFLMEIAVDAYNPSKVADVGYFVDKGIGMLDIAMNMDGVATDLKGVYDHYSNVKAAAETIRSAMYFHDGRWNVRMSMWDEYWEAANNLTEGLQSMQDLASKGGEKSSWFGRRAARDRAQIRSLSAPEMSEEALRAIDKRMLREIENLGGLFFGGNRFQHQGYEWGYFEPSQNYQELPKFVGVPSAPAFNFGGTNIAYLEYFDGVEWRTFPGLSSTGADPLFLPTTPVSSWGNGSAENPVIYLGEFTIDVPLDVVVSGALVNQHGDPVPNITVGVSGNHVVTDSSGQFTLNVDSLADYVVVTYGSYSRSYSVNRNTNTVDVGDIRIYQGVNWAKEMPYAVDGLSIAPEERKAVITIAATPDYGNDKILYEYRLDRNRYFSTQSIAPLTQGRIETDAPFEFEFDLNEYLPRVGQDAFTGSYYLTIKAYTADAIDPTKPTSTRTVTFNVKNNEPEILEFTVDRDSDKLGAIIDVHLVSTDPDGVGNLSSVSVYELNCRNDEGRLYGLWSTRISDSVEPDLLNGTEVVEPGKRTTHFRIDTHNARNLWSMESESFECSLTVRATDKSWSYDEETYNFTLAQNQVAPTISYSSLKEEYVVNNNTVIYPSSLVRFEDMNGDIVSYTVDCGYDTEGSPATGEESVSETSADPISYIGETEYGCRYDVYSVNPDTGYYDTSLIGPMSGKEYTFSYTAKDRQGHETTASTTIKVLQPIRVTLTNEDGSPLIETVTRNALCSASQLALNDPTVCNDSGELLRCDNELENCTTVEVEVDLPVALPSSSEAQRKVLINTINRNEDGMLTNRYYYVYHRPDRHGWWSQNITSQTEVGEDGVIELTLNRPGIYTVHVDASEYKKDPDTGEPTGYRRFSVYYSKEIVVTSHFDAEITIDGLLPEEFVREGKKLTTDQPIRFSAETMKRPVEGSWDPKYEWRLIAYGANEEDPPAVTNPCDQRECDLTLQDVGEYQIEVEIYNEKDPVDENGLRPTLLKSQTFQLFKRPTVTLGADYSPRVPNEVTLGDRYTATVSYDPSLVQRTQWLVQIWTGAEWVQSYGHSIISTTPQSLELVLKHEGTYRITSIVTTKDGVTMSFPGEEFVVTQYPPRIEALMADQLEVSPGGEVTLTAEGFDLDARDTDRLGFDWFLDDGFIRSTTSEGAVGPSKTASSTFKWILPLSQGEQEYKFGVRVVDSTGLRSDAANLIIKTVFKSPVVTVNTLPSDSKGTKPLEVSFTASVEKGDGEIVRYEWRSDAGADIDPEALESATWSYTYTEHGSYLAHLKVIDIYGKSDEIEIPITVFDHAPPYNVTIVTDPEPATGNFPLRVNFTGSAEEGDGALVNYAWQPRAGAEWYESTSPNFTYTYTEPGLYTARLKVTDSNGKVSQEVGKAISVIDPNALENVTIRFRERRADGLGPDYLFPEHEEDDIFHEFSGVPDFIHVPLVGNALDWDASTVQKVDAIALNFNQFGLFGVSEMHWTQVDQSMLQIDREGTYDYGVEIFPSYYDDEDGEVVSLKNLEDEYTCGYVAFGMSGNDFYGEETLEDPLIFPFSTERRIDDTMPILAFFGTGKVDYQGTCDFTYVAVLEDSTEPYILPKESLSMLPLQITYPELENSNYYMELSSAEIVDDSGDAFFLFRRNIPFADGEYQMPLVPGRKVVVEMELLRKEQYGDRIISTAKVEANLKNGQFELDLSELQLSDPTGFVMKNMPNNFMITYVENSADATIKTQLHYLERIDDEDVTGSYLKTKNPTDIFFELDTHRPDSKGFGFRSTYDRFVSEFTSGGRIVMDLSEHPRWVQDVTPGEVEVVVDQEEKVMTFNFPTAQGDFCSFELGMLYAHKETNSLYDRDIELVFKPALGSFSVPIPYTSQIWDEEGELVEKELDQIDSLTLVAYCGRLTDEASYDHFIKELLAKFNTYDFTAAGEHLMMRYAGERRAIEIPGKEEI